MHVRRCYHAGHVGPPKSKYGKRRLRLTPDLAQAFWRHRSVTKAAYADLVFTATGGSRVDPSNLMRRVLKPAAVEAGLGEWVRDERGANPPGRARLSLRPFRCLVSWEGRGLLGPILLATFRQPGLEQHLDRPGHGNRRQRAEDAADFRADENRDQDRQR